MGLITDKTDDNPPTVIIEKPKGHLYIFDKELVPLPTEKSIVLGRISVTFSAVDDETDIAMSEIFVDTQLKHTTQEQQYTWLWDETAVGAHSIQIKSYDNAGNEALDEVDVLIINLM